MKTVSSLAVGTATVLAITASWGSQAVSTAFLRNSEVWVRGPGSADAYQITNDGIGKRLLVLSKGGDRLAFLRDSAAEMADIVVMRTDGSLLNEIHFRPVGEPVSGMRGVEQMEWISQRRLVLSGSINPSTGEYDVLDAETGALIKAYGTDGSTWVASPDGEHAAYLGFIGHFTPEADRRPRICLDDECGLGPSRGYPKEDVHVDFITSPEWSPDSSAVAIIAENYDTHVDSVIVRHVGGKTLDILAPSQAEGSLGVAWNGNVLVLSGTNRRWRLEPGASTFVVVRSADPANAIHRHFAQSPQQHNLPALEPHATLEPENRSPTLHGFVFRRFLTT
jgi:hypothetical protein